MEALQGSGAIQALDPKAVSPFPEHQSPHSSKIRDKGLPYGILKMKGYGGVVDDRKRPTMLAIILPSTVPVCSAGVLM